jgi:hypothetical protein
VTVVDLLHLSGSSNANTQLLTLSCHNGPHAAAFSLPEIGPSCLLIQETLETQRTLLR